MKTMKKGRKIVRVPESQVSSHILDGYKFCPKEEWKKKVRDKVSVKKSTEKKEK